MQSNTPAVRKLSTSHAQKSAGGLLSEAAAVLNRRAQETRIPTRRTRALAQAAEVFEALAIHISRLEGHDPLEGDSHAA